MPKCRRLRSRKVAKICLQTGQKGLSCKAREKSTSGGVLAQYVGARRLSATKQTSLFQRSILTPGGVGGHQVLAEAALGRGGQPALALLEVELEVARLPVRRQRRLVAVDLVEIEKVRVVPVLDHVEAQAAGLVLLRMLRIVADDFQELRDVLGFYLDSHVQHYHGCTSCLGEAILSVPLRPTDQLQKRLPTPLIPFLLQIMRRTLPSQIWRACRPHPAPRTGPRAWRPQGFRQW